MITKDDVQAKLDSIEEDCQEVYYSLPEFEGCESPVWDNYCENAFDLYEQCDDDEEEKQELLDSLCIEDFENWLLNT